jgi:hypothetical protein
MTHTRFHALRGSTFTNTNPKLTIQTPKAR